MLYQIDFRNLQQYTKWYVSYVEKGIRWSLPSLTIAGFGCNNLIIRNSLRRFRALTSDFKDTIGYELWNSLNGH